MNIKSIKQQEQHKIVVLFLQMTYITQKINLILKSSLQKILTNHTRTTF